jgi:hypothetical protein
VVHHQGCCAAEASKRFDISKWEFDDRVCAGPGYGTGNDWHGLVVTSIMMRSRSSRNHLPRINSAAFGTGEFGKPSTSKNHRMMQYYCFNPVSPAQNCDIENPRPHNEHIEHNEHNNFQISFRLLSPSAEVSEITAAPHKSRSDTGVTFLNLDRIHSRAFLLHDSRPSSCFSLPHESKGLSVI